ncbi:MAG: efflux RND transporter periplasmic adaptor subunit [Anaerolineae bacterium]|jgi:HlyD family secretion protein|uniref:efflux RND transporter periplasmic adaptor subunit n=1 Tax=Candidatus Amarolinea dominans TaxID=3140696 RepID=UPI0031363808|nr:efflux RND transporter periplasmic adaptor subunit [Anaerolineae bacterium]MBK9233576.1 efflux RND transporter periplasmic adaptor subunit [Anaerolineae bacterium]
MKQVGKKKRRLSWLFIVLPLVVVALAAGGWYYFGQRAAATKTPATPALQTAKVRTGDITITASGAGNLLPASETALAFRTSGLLAQAAVKVGDRVEAGQVLARLDDADARAQVAQAEANLRLAELKLADLMAGADPAAVAAARASLAAAQADLSRLITPATASELLGAQENLRSTQEALALLLAGPDPAKLTAARATLTLAEINVRAAQAAYDKIADRADAGATAQAAALWQATTNYEKAAADYETVQAGPAADVITAARAKVAVAKSQLDAAKAAPDAAALKAAEAKVAQTQAQLDALLAGPNANDSEAARLSVTLTRYSLENAQRALNNTQLRAPISGTVLAVNAEAGETVGTAPIITVADLSASQLRFWVEESDLMSVAPGNPVQIVFDALPDLVFAGKVLRVDPSLVTVEGTSAVQAWASIDLAQHPVKLLSGLTAEVEIIAGEAKGALLVPVQALRELAPGSYAVFVVKADGQLEMRPVTVGLRDFANAQIISGLAKGDVVSTGTVETK